MKTGFDNQKYLKMQSEHIRDRISKFDNKLYLEFGGKLFDDYHASRVLPGFEPDSKLRMLMQLSDQAEIVIVISAADIDKNKMRGDLGITYDEDVLRLIDEFTGRGLYVGSVCITRYAGQESADLFKKRLEKLGTGKGYSVLDIVKNFEAATGVKIPYSIKPRRAGDVATCYSDATKAKKELGWEAEYDIKDMCADSWNFQQKNPNGYED